MDVNEAKQAFKEGRLVTAGGEGRRTEIAWTDLAPQVGDVVPGGPEVPDHYVITAILESPFANVASVEIQRLVPGDWEAGPDAQMPTRTQTTKF